MKPYPHDLKAVGTIVKLGATSLKATIIGHAYDDHSLGGWGYKMQWLGGLRGTFVWPHGNDTDSSRIKDLHPLEQLGAQAK